MDVAPTLLDEVGDLILAYNALQQRVRIQQEQIEFKQRPPSLTAIGQSAAHEAREVVRDEQAETDGAGRAVGGSFFHSRPFGRSGWGAFQGRDAASDGLNGVRRLVSRID